MAQVISAQHLDKRLGALGFSNLAGPVLIDWLAASEAVQAKHLILYLEALSSSPSALDDMAIPNVPAEVANEIRKMLRARGVLV